MSGKTLQRDIRFDDAGFAIVPYEKPPVAVRWTDVREVFAMKRDLFAIDEICLGFTLDEAGGYVRTGEDDGGFLAFRTEVERRFKIDPTWFGRIVQPPFAENRTTLWRRP